MKNKINLPTPSSRPNWLCRGIVAVTLLALMVFLGNNARAATIVFTNNASSVWTNKLNWNPNQVPGPADNAYIDGSSAQGNLAISALDTGGIQQVGSFTVGPSRTVNANIEPSTGNGTTNPVLVIYGVGGILLSNASTTAVMGLLSHQTGDPQILSIALAASGCIYASTPNPAGSPPSVDGTVDILTPILETNGSQSIILNGPGYVYFQTNNSYSGSTIISNGAAQIDDNGSFGNGTGTVYLSGGNINCNASRTGTSSTQTPIPNPIVLTTNAYIFNVAGTATTRDFPLTGSLGGTNGTLIICNPTTTSGNTFNVRLGGTFTFNLPVIVGNQSDPFGNGGYEDNSSSFSQIELDNAPGTGTQTFNGNIAGVGAILRSSFTTSVGGTTIFTASNSYSGGTIITSGSLFANNTFGSALGTGNVTATNLGTLAGNGFVIAPTTVILNGTIQPGATSNSVGNLSVSTLTLGPGASYKWQINSTNGKAGASWDLITCSSGWTDAGSPGSPNTLYLTSPGAVTNWKSSVAYSWMIISNSGSATGFNAANWAINTSGFTASNTVAGVFALTTDANGDLLLNYTPAVGNFVIDVESGSVFQGGVSPTPYPLLTGLDTVTKVGNGEVILTNSLNNYQGQTFIDAGTASAAVNSTTAGGAFGASTAPLVLGNTLGNSNATLNIDQTGVLVGNSVTVQSGSTGVKTIGTTVAGIAATYSGSMVLNDNVTLNSPTASAVSYGGNFSGSGGITFAGNGTNTVSGVATYTGPTTLAGGTLQLDASAIGTNVFTIATGSTLDNTSGGSVTLGNNPPQIWNAVFNFTGTESLNLGTGPVTLATNCTLSIGGGILTVGGTIAGNGGLTLPGPGELSLAGATNNTYTGGTTNFGGILAINATTSFGNGLGSLVFSGTAGTTNFLLDTGSHGGFPLSNPVVFNTTTRVYGNSTDTAAPTRVLPFSGPFSVLNGSSLYVDDIGSATTIFSLRLVAVNGSTVYTNINWPIVLGDPTFDTASTTIQLDLQNDNTTPPQILNSLVSGSGEILRSTAVLNEGGTTIFDNQNTFSGGVFFYSGAVGLGTSSVTNSSGLVSGPLGTGTFQLGEGNGEILLTVFAPYAPVELDNHLYLDGDTNIYFGGTNNILLTGSVDSGTAAKTLGVTNGLTVTFAGVIKDSGTAPDAPLTKAGGGTLILSGQNAYTGTTTVSGGTLLVDGLVGPATVTVNPAGTLGGDGTISGSAIFTTGAKSYITNGAPLTIAGDLTLNGNTLAVDLAGASTLGIGTYTLINYAGALSGSFNPTPVIVDGSLGSGQEATVDLSTTNEVNLVVTAGGPTTPPNFPRGGIAQLANGGISLVATGALGGQFSLLASTNLALPFTNWTVIQTGTVTASPFTNFDLTATNYSKRFYLFTAP